MRKIRLSYACGDYDLMQPIRDRSIAPEGISIDFFPVSSPREIFDRMTRKHEFDLSEFSCSEFISMAARGNSPFVALPVFPSRAFRHGFFCVNRKARVTTAKDIEGRRVGVPLYSQTAAVWMRGILQDDYDVDLETITWVQGSVEAPGHHGNPVPLPLLRPVNIEENASDRSLSELLAEGGIDALIGSRLPSTLGTHPDVVRLFPDFHEVEKDYARRTGNYPILHLVALRKELCVEHPWIAQPLYDAFCAAKDKAVRGLEISGEGKNMLLWLSRHLEDVHELPGPSPWPYGRESNRKTLETLVRYMADQHFIAQPIDIDDLFLPVGP